MGKKLLMAVVFVECMFFFFLYKTGSTDIPNINNYYQYNDYYDSQLAQQDNDASSNIQLVIVESELDVKLKSQGFIDAENKATPAHPKPDDKPIKSIETDVQKNARQPQEKHVENSQQKDYHWISFQSNRLIIQQNNKPYKTYQQYEKENNITRINIESQTPVITASLPSFGLGNRMFTYASVYAIARENNRTFQYLNNGIALVDFFEIKEKVVDSRMTDVINNQLKISDGYCCTYNAAFMDLPPIDITLPGLFQSWRFFDKYKGEIRKQFTFKQQQYTNVNSPQTFIAQLRSKHGTETIFVGVHIRRGDMLKTQARKHGHKVADKEYLERALHYIEGKLNKKCVYIVCSDDMVWSKENLPGQERIFEFSEKKSAPFDMELLTLCDHVILTVGTFGWWGAYLNQGQSSDLMVVYYKDWPKKGSGFAIGLNHEDYFPAHWIGL